jgi:hypothetical protein
MNSFIICTTFSQTLLEGQKRITWAKHVARMGEIMRTKFWSECLKEMGHSEDLGVDSRILLKYILREQATAVWTCYGSEFSPVAES